MFNPCAVTCDYLIKCYSLCDIGILAPIFVMVIKFHLCDIDELCLCNDIFSSDCVLAMSSVFVATDEFCLCDGIVKWHWVRFSGFGIVLLLLKVYNMQFHGSILRSFMLYHFNHSCHIIIGNAFVEFIWKLPNYNMLCKIFIIMKLAFPLPPLIMLLTGLCFIPFFHQTISKQVVIF